MSAAQWFSALQTRSKREVQEAFNRKQEEIQLRNIRHATFGQELDEIKQDLLTQEDRLRATYADDPKYLSELDNVINYDFRGGNPSLDFFQKTFKKDIFGYGFETVLDRTGFTQAITGNPNIITVAAENDEQGNFNPVLVNKAGGGDGSKQVITTATEDAVELQFGGVPYKLTQDASGKFLNSYLSKLRQTTKGTSFANLATLEAVATGIPVPPRNNIASLTGVPVEAMEDATAAPTPGGLMASIISGAREPGSLSEDEFQEALNDPYLAYLIDGQQMENIDDLGTLKSVADQGMYSGINRRIIESAWKEYEKNGGPDATQGRRTNNPLNLKFNAKNDWMGKKESENGFETFDDMAYGIRAADDTLRTYDNYNIDTVAKVINRWAPPNENNTDEYIKFVAKELNISPNDKIDLQNDETRQNLLKAMVKMESPDVTLTDEMIAAARDLSVVAYRGLSTRKQDLVGEGYKAKIRGKTVVENTLPFIEYKDAEGRYLTGDALFDEIMGEPGFIRGEPLSQTGPAQGRPTSYRGDDFATRNDVTVSDLLAGNNKYKSYFYKEGSTPFDLTADQVDSLDNRQRNLLLLKAKQVTKSNLNRMRNNIVDQKEQFSDANETFYQKVAGKLGLGLGNKRTRRELQRDNQLDQFFSNNPEYGREFFDLGAKAFADKYQNDLGFAKNFPTTEDKEFFKKELKELKHNARKELSDLLVYRTDENSDKANLEFLDTGERFKMLSLLYTSQAGGQKPLIATNDFSDAMRSFTATGQIDFAAATGTGTEKPLDPLDYANIGGGIQPIVDKLFGFKRNEQGDLVKGQNARAAFSLVFDSDAAETAINPNPLLGNADEIRRLMEFKAQNFNNPQIVNMVNDVLETEQLRRLVGHADFDIGFGRDLTPDQFQDTIMMNVPPMISVQLKHKVGQDEFTYFPMNAMQAANMISNGARLHGYQFYGDDGRTTGEFVEAADLPEFDQQSMIDMLGIGTNANGKLSRTADLQARLQAAEED